LFRRPLIARRHLVGKEGAVEQIVERCAGIDVGQAEVVVCARVPDAARGGAATELVATYGTTTPDLLRLRDWLAGLGVTQVAMESTGVYWKPVYYLLEDDFAVILANAAHVKHVPGRKTDTIDAVWLAQLLAHGLLSPSFVPPPPIRALRDLTRYRKALINERTAQVNRTHKVLQDAGIKIATFASDIMGVSARAMMRSLIAGEHDPALLADLAKGRMRAKIPDLNKALTGRFGEHHAFLLRRMLDHIEAQEAEIAELDARIEELVSPFAAQVQLLATIPGVDRRSAETILAEIGPDMRVFPTPGHLASWAGMCPGQRDSAGKRGSGRTRKGSKWLRATLVQSGRAATRTKSTYLHERYLQIRRRRGDARAVVAVGHEILIAAYRVLATGEPYLDPGPVSLTERIVERERRRALHTLKQLGYHVTLEPSASVA
jgi:transposase